MSLEDEIKADVKAVENLFHNAVNDVQAEIQPGLDYLKANVPAAAITIGEAILAGADAGTPWATLVTTLIAQAETAGIKLAENAAKVALNTAQTNQIAKAAS